jgi:hypothetical protein
MSDSTTKLEDAQRSSVMAAMYLAVPSVIALAASVHMACNRSGFDLVTTGSHMTWGAGGYTVAIAALVLPFASRGRIARRRR